MAMLALIGTAMSVVGAIKQGNVAKAQGQQVGQAKDYQAAQFDEQAGQAQAVAQRNALEQRRRAKLVASRALAVAAASGGSASDPTVAKLIADIDGEGAHRAALELYQGEDQARKLRMAGDAARYEGEVARRGGQTAQTAYQLQGLAQGLKVGSSLYQKYGQSDPYNLREAGNQYAWD